jgi:hypothetical protein
VGALREELLAESVLHADETPVAMLKPGNGKTLHIADIFFPLHARYAAVPATAALAKPDVAHDKALAELNFPPELSASLWRLWCKERCMLICCRPGNKQCLTP